MSQTPIAERQLTTEDGRAVTIQIYPPTPETDPSPHWRCEFEIRGAIDEIEHGSGLDSFQALVNAIQGVRKYLDDSGLSLTWAGGEPGDHGVPCVVPQFFGRAFAKDIEDEIDRRLASHRPPGRGSS
jgi:hypothetical protein